MYLLLDYRLQTTNCRMPLEQIKMEIENVCDICQLDLFFTILRRKCFRYLSVRFLLYYTERYIHSERLKKKKERKKENI